MCLLNLLFCQNGALDCCDFQCGGTGDLESDRLIFAAGKAASENWQKQMKNSCKKKKSEGEKNVYSKHIKLYCTST